MWLIRWLITLLKKLHGGKEKAALLPPTLVSSTFIYRSDNMAKVTIPITVNLTRTDGTVATIDQVKQMDVFASLDGGPFNNVATLPPDATEVVIDGVDPGSNGLAYATATDTQKNSNVTVPSQSV